MMLFQRRIFLELMGNGVMAFVLMAAVLMLVATLQIVQMIQGLSPTVFIKAIPIFLAAGIDLLLPMSVLVAVVLTYGRWAADNEIDTLRASGVHPLHLLTPGLVFGALMSAVLLVSLDYAKPYAERFKRALTKDVDLSLILAQKLASGEPERIDDNTVISAGWIDEDGMAHDLRIRIEGDDGSTKQEIIAERAMTFVDVEANKLVVELFDFRTVVGQRVRSKKFSFIRPLTRLETDFKIPSMTTPQLVAWLDRDEERRGIFKVPDVMTAVNMRLSSAVTCVVFVLLGLPVAVRFKRNDRVGAFLVAFVLALVLYYPSVRVSKALSEEGVLDPSIAAWAGHAVLLLAAGALSWRLYRR